MPITHLLVKAWQAFTFTGTLCAVVFRPEVLYRNIGLLVCSHLIAYSGSAISLHRYFAHKSFETGRLFQFVLAIWGSLSLQGGPLFWASRHRHHHKQCDKPDDAHSPEHHGVYAAHIGWLFEKDIWDDTIYYKFIEDDLLKFPELRLFDITSPLPILLLILIHYYMAGLEGLVVGVVTNFTSFHCMQLVNSVNHMYGYLSENIKSKSYACHARNSIWMFPFQLGENLHSNHHRIGKRYHNMEQWWEFDLMGYTIQFMGLLGLVWDLKECKIID